MFLIQIIVSSVKQDFLKQAVISETFVQMDELLVVQGRLTEDAIATEERMASEGFRPCGRYILLHNVDRGTSAKLDDALATTS